MTIILPIPWMYKIPNRNPTKRVPIDLRHCLHQQCGESESPPCLILSLILAALGRPHNIITFVLPDGGARPARTLPRAPSVDTLDSLRVDDLHQPVATVDESSWSPILEATILNITRPNLCMKLPLRTLRPSPPFYSVWLHRRTHRRRSITMGS